MSRCRGVNLLLVLTGVLVGLCILEVGLRVAGISYPYFYVPDPIVGYAHKPYAEGWWKKEGLAYVRISSAGFRDREHTKEKPSGTFRIAVLGDSYSEALQVPIEQTYWAIVESKLRQCRALDGRPVEVMNFGVSGYSTGQELLVLQHRVWDYVPDLVLLALLTGNDIQENSFALTGDSIRPYFVLQDGRLSLDSSFRGSLTYRLQSLPFSSEAFEYSRVLQVLREGKYRLLSRLRDSSLRKNMAAANREAETPLESFVYVEPRQRAWEEAWQVTEMLLDEVHKDVMRRSADFLLVTLSNPAQVHPDSRQRRVYAGTVGVQDLRYPDRRIASWAEHHDVTLLSLVQPLAAYAEEHQVFLHGFSNATLGDGHWNAEGHRVAGDLIAQKVCSLSHLR